MLSCFCEFQNFCRSSKERREKSEQSRECRLTIVAHLCGKIPQDFTFGHFTSPDWCRQAGVTKGWFSFHTIVRYAMKLFHRKIDNFHAKMWFKLSWIFSSLPLLFLININPTQLHKLFFTFFFLKLQIYLLSENFHHNSLSFRM